MVLPRRTLTTIDAHAGGEPLRLITSGVPRLRGATILERRKEMLEQHDDIRRALMWEPRGYYCSPTTTCTADVLFDNWKLPMINEGLSADEVMARYRQQGVDYLLL